MGKFCESPVHPISCLLPCTPHRTPPSFFFLIHSPSKSFISWEWAIKKIRIFFFPSPQSFVTCPIKLTASYKEKYPKEGLDALQDFQLGHPASLLCPCAQCPGVDRRGERKKKVRRWGGGWGGVGDKYQVLRQNKSHNEVLHPYAFSFLYLQYKMHHP